MPLRGNVQIPTIVPEVPSGFKQLFPGDAKLPTYQLTGTVSLLDPETGIKTRIGSSSQLLKLGNTLSIPVSFNTGGLKEKIYQYWLTIQDASGRTLYDNIIPPQSIFLKAKGLVQAAVGGAPGLPKPELPVLKLPEPPAPIKLPAATAPIAPSKFLSMEINLSPSKVNVGGVLSVPVTYTHLGYGEQAVIRVSVGDFRAGFFDEVWAAEVTEAVPIDVIATPHRTSVSIPITSKIAAAGIYTVEAKVDGGVPRVITRRQNLVEVLASLTESQILRVDVQLRATEVQVGGTLTVPFSYQHNGAEELVTAYAAVGDSGFAGFNEILAARQSLSIPQDTSLNSRSGSISIPITSKIAANKEYAVQVKLIRSASRRDVVSPAVDNIVRVAGAATTAPTPAPIPGAPAGGASNIPRVDVSMRATSIPVGATLNVPFSYQHSGAAELVTAYASVGNSGAFGFDPILAARQSLSIPQDTNLNSRSGSISIPISSKIAANKTYAVEVKLIRSAGRRDVVSPTATDIVTVIGATPAAPTPDSAKVTAPAPTKPIEVSYKFSIGPITASPATIKPGAMVFVKAPVTSQSTVPVKVTVYFRFYEGSRTFTTHGTFLGQSGGMTYEIKPGETYTFQAARIETSNKDTFDVACDVTVSGSTIASREDDDVYRGS